MIFDALDEEKDGEIELQQLVHSMSEKFKITIELKAMKQIMYQCDMDFDGKMQFTEFLIAACNKRGLLSE